MNIRVDLNTAIADGTEVVFRSPADCSQVTGMVVYHNGGKTEFAFADAHGNNVGDIDHLFAENAVVKVILDVATSMAFVQNADTNGYIEGTFVKSVNGKKPDKLGNVEVPVAGATHEQIVAAVEDYLSKNPVSGGVDAEQLTQAVEAALQEAKESGRFDGEDGYTPVKGKDYFTEADKTELVQAVGERIEIPTVPAWAQSENKPAYTAGEVGADAAGTAASKVAEHDGSEEAHGDIRLLVKGLTDRLNALADSDDTTLDQMSELVAYIKSNKSLIDGITTGKVSVTDIVDNLTTGVANKPLSAKQGVALKALIDKIVIPTKVSQLTNDSGYLTSAPVTSVNGKNGAVVLSASDVGALPNTTPIPSIPASLPANGGNADTVGGKTAEQIQQAAAGGVSAAVNTALEQAKASGEFDGKTPEKGVDYWTEADKAEIMEALNMKESIYSEKVTKNLFDEVWEQGSLNADGTANNSSDAVSAYYRSKNFIPVEGGKRLNFNSEGGIIDSVKLAQYNVNKQIIGSDLSNWSRERNRWTNNGITLHANTRYIRFWCGNQAQMNIFYHENINEMFADPGDVFIHIPHLEKTYLGEFIPTSAVASPLIGKKIAYDGDSICIGTYGGGGYAKLIADNVGGFYENQAVGGARLVSKEGSSGNYHSIVDNLPNLPKDADLYCFDGGVNDVWSLVSLGTYSMSDYTGTVDKTTICGALETIFRYCLSNFVGKPICFIITHKVSNIDYDNYKNYHDAAVAICNKYSIPYYDAYNESGLNGWNTTQSTTFLTGNSNGTADGCHPNEEGYRRYYVPQLIRLFERIMP